MDDIDRLHMRQDCERIPDFKFNKLLQMGVVASSFLTSPSQSSDSVASQRSHRSLPNTDITINEFLSIQNQIRLDQSGRNVPRWDNRNPQALFGMKVATNGKETGCGWTWVLSRGGLVDKVGQYCWFAEWEEFRKVSGGLRRWAIETALKRENNWDMTMWRIAPLLAKSNGLRESAVDEDYEHSQDLDRTSGYLQQCGSQDLVAEQQTKIDRVMTTLSFHMRYFQGVMPICASLLQCFNEQVAYWLLRLLLSRCRLVQLNLELYTWFMGRLQEEMQVCIPGVHQKLHDCGLEVDYFAMKWVMGLFSEDMSQAMQLAFWDVLCQSELQYLVYLIIALLKSQQDQILKGDTDSINTLLKGQLKSKLSQLNCEQFISYSKALYLQRRVYSKASTTSLPPI